MSEITQAHHDHLAFLNVCATPGEELPLCGCELCDDWRVGLLDASVVVQGFTVEADRG